MIRVANIEDAKAIAQVAAETWKDVYKNIIPKDYLDTINTNEWESRWRDNIKSGRHVFVSIIDDKIVGFASGEKSRCKDLPYDAELYSIYVLASHQGKGLGKALFTKVVNYLTENNFHSMLIWVLADNPFCRFYEKMGGKAISSRKEEIGGKVLDEIAYGWSNLFS